MWEHSLFSLVSREGTKRVNTRRGSWRWSDLSDYKAVHFLLVKDRPPFSLDNNWFFSPFSWHVQSSWVRSRLEQVPIAKGLLWDTFMTGPRPGLCPSAAVFRSAQMNRTKLEKELEYDSTGKKRCRFVQSLCEEYWGWTVRTVGGSDQGSTGFARSVNADCSHQKNDSTGSLHKCLKRRQSTQEKHHQPQSLQLKTTFIYVEVTKTSSSFRWIVTLVPQERVVWVNFSFR